MKKLAPVLAVVLLVGGAATAVVLARARAPKHPPAPTRNVHGEGLDREMSSLKAMYDAPPGATPCETAYNAFKASQDTARATGKTPLVLKLAPRDEFLSRCGALPAEAQPCLAPAYLVGHHEECARARPPADVLKPMFEIKPIDGVPPGEQDAERQFQATQPRPAPR